ncbi:hypothetical protein OH77DRAFT_951013 [Trametes cingulata]|nr:hypothetical protein OH77DRAFT_951013 [Trametes cingulata]
MSLCNECVKGVRHEGDPEGKIVQIGGVECYIATPPEGEYDKRKVVLFLSDVFSIPLINNKVCYSSHILLHSSAMSVSSNVQVLGSIAASRLQKPPLSQDVLVHCIHLMVQPREF